MMFTAVALLSASLATLAGAWTTPVGDQPSGNPISSPTLNEIVPVGKPYTIRWNPTSTGTVTLLLLRGPSTNVVPLYAIAERIENTGSYTWLPSTSLEPDTSRYGIQLIQDSNGAYQYSTQFGISGGSGSSSSSSHSSSSSVSSSITTKIIPSGATYTYTYNASCTQYCTGYNKTSTHAYPTGTVSLHTTDSAKPTGSKNISTGYSTVPLTTATRVVSTAAASASSGAPASSQTQSANAAVSQFGSSGNKSLYSTVMLVAGGILAAWFI